MQNESSARPCALQSYSTSLPVGCRKTLYILARDRARSAEEIGVVSSEFTNPRKREVKTQDVTPEPDPKPYQGSDNRGTVRLSNGSDQADLSM